MGTSWRYKAEDVGDLMQATFYAKRHDGDVEYLIFKIRLVSQHVSKIYYFNTVHWQNGIFVIIVANVLMTVLNVV